MRTYILAGVLLLSGTFSVAASSKTTKSKARTLGSLIAMTMKQGAIQEYQSHVINDLEIPAEDLNDGKLMVRLITYKQAISPDNRKHVFNVLYRADPESGKEKPTLLLMDSVKGWAEAGQIHADVYSMVVSLDGTLRKIVSIQGIVGQGKLTKIDTDSAEARDILRREMAFYTQASAGLPMTTK